MDESNNNEPIFSNLNSKYPTGIVTGSLSNANSIAGENGTVTPYLKSSASTSVCNCGVGSTIYYIVSFPN